MQPIIKGTKKKLECSVRGMNYLYLTDDDVDFTVHFYVSGKHAQGCAEVTKSDCYFIYEEGSTDSNTFHVVCDTSLLPLGQLVAVLDITYLDIDTAKQLVDKVEVEFDDSYIIRDM